MSSPSSLHHLPTPALVVDRSTFDANVGAMAEHLPGRRLRPHVKAFKSTALAAELELAGHHSFCAATPREIAGMAAAGVGDDLMLANESLRLDPIRPYVDQVSITVAVDSDATLAAAIDAGVRSVLIDVEVGLPRCGCLVEEAGPLAERARGAGLEVRGVMGYEGHLMMVTDPEEKRAKVEECMQRLLTAHEAVGGEIVSGGGTGTSFANTWCTEIQAGSYCLMDSQYDQLDLPFRPALTLLGTVISVSPKGWIVADVGLKAQGMDHGNPSWDEGEVVYCSDEHVTLAPTELADWSVGDRVRLTPAHVDPTIAKHECLWVADGDAVVDRWEVDLRHW